MKYRRADLVSRILAFALDVLIAGLLFIIPLPIIRSILSASYLLLRDVIMYEITRDKRWRNRSPGKRVLGLQVVVETNTKKYKNITRSISLQRNFIPALGLIAGIIPLLGLILAPVISLIVWVIELIAAISHPKQKRLGDRLARTVVIQKTPSGEK